MVPPWPAIAALHICHTWLKGCDYVVLKAWQLPDSTVPTCIPSCSHVHPLTQVVAGGEEGGGAEEVDPSKRLPPYLSLRPHSRWMESNGDVLLTLHVVYCHLLLLLHAPSDMTAGMYAAGCSGNLLQVVGNIGQCTCSQA